MKTVGIFTISLDFELHWGMFDVAPRQKRLAIYQKTLQAIPAMLDLFDKYQVHVTWATVGSLFAKNHKEWEALSPVRKPNYHNTRLSAYDWVKQESELDVFKEAHFAPEAIKAIQDCPGQEIGSHTFSHYYCLKAGQCVEDFKEDLEAMNKAASLLGIVPTSLVLPRNQFNPAYSKAAYEAGYKVIRTNPNNWLWETSRNIRHRIIKKAYRSTNSYFHIGNEMTYPLQSVEVAEEGPILLPRGHCLLPYKPSNAISQALKLRRIMAEIKEAAIQSRCCHIWWHPEDFGSYTQHNLKRLEMLLQQYKYCKERYGMVSWNMGDYATYLLNEKSSVTTIHTTQSMTQSRQA